MDRLIRAIEPFLYERHPNEYLPLYLGSQNVWRL